MKATADSECVNPSLHSVKSRWQ